MKRVRRKHKREENDPFSRIYVDLIVDILLKIPAKFVVRLVFVSKQWSSIIRGRDFTKLYMARSSTRPRLLFTVSARKQFIQSYSQKDPSSDRQSVNIPHPSRLESLDDFFPLVHGLICGQYDSKVMIGNPSTGQFLTLPRVKTRRRGLYSLLGYDPVNDVYKVLCKTGPQNCDRRESKVVLVEHQVYTLGAGQNSWRMIECKHPHLTPYYIKGLCINGVLYYYAWIKSEGSLISFDLTSEEFNVIKLPEDIPWLVNYTRKIALRSQSNGKLDLWVLADAKRQEWSKVSVLVPSWIDLSWTNTGFRFRGTLRTGELIFSPMVSFINPFYFISYDLKENNAKKVVVEGIGNHFASLKVYFDHVESPMFPKL